VRQQALESIAADMARRATAFVSSAADFCRSYCCCRVGVVRVLPVLAGLLLSALFL